MATTISSAMMPGRGYTRSFRVDLLTASSSYAFPSTDPTSQTGKLSSPPQEVYFASSSADGTVRIWSAASLTCIHILGNKSMAMPAVLSCVLTQEYAASGYVDGTVMLHPSDDVYTSPSPPQQQQQQASSSAESRNQISNGKGHETSVVKDPSLQGHSQEPGHRHAATEREERGERAVSAQQQVNQLEREFERALRLFIRIQYVVVILPIQPHVTPSYQSLLPHYIAGPSAQTHPSLKTVSEAQNSSCVSWSPSVLK